MSIEIKYSKCSSVIRDSLIPGNIPIKYPPRAIAHTLPQPVSLTELGVLSGYGVNAIGFPFFKLTPHQIALTFNQTSVSRPKRFLEL